MKMSPYCSVNLSSARQLRQPYRLHVSSEPAVVDLHELTAAKIVLHGRLLSALVPVPYLLILQLGAPVTVAVRVHGDLQRVAFPAKHVVSVVAVAGRIAVAPDERLGAIFRPLGLVVERRRVPDDFVEQLRNADGVRGWTGAAVFERAALGIRYVAGVVGGVEVDAIPAAERAA